MAERTDCCDALFLEDSDVCSECKEHAVSQTEARHSREWQRMTLVQQREAMGGEFGGDGPDD